MEQNQNEVLKRSLLTGWLGGLFWALIAMIMSYLNFIELHPRHLFLRPYLNIHRWTDSWQGDLLVVGMLSVVSIFIAVIYYFIFKSIRSSWVGFAYGVMLWLLLMFVYIPMITSLPHFGDLHKETYIGTFCLFILYGLFIGFSISYDYEDTILKNNPKHFK
ncbi:MAG TPA: hypothetical protein IAA78_09350 [Candidatus Avamphibacillus intestinigallinarum]|nr:hypothetical protein [Candidatus Avamphibacillus intestinigallinarum]